MTYKYKLTPAALAAAAKHEITENELTVMATESLDKIFGPRDKQPSLLISIFSVPYADINEIADIDTKTTSLFATMTVFSSDLGEYYLLDVADMKTFDVSKDLLEKQGMPSDGIKTMVIPFPQSYVSDQFKEFLESFGISPPTADGKEAANLSGVAFAAETDHSNSVKH